MGGDAPQTPRLRVGSARAFCPVPFAPCLLPRAALHKPPAPHPPTKGRGSGACSAGGRQPPI